MNWLCEVADGEIDGQPSGWKAALREHQGWEAAPIYRHSLNLEPAPVAK